MFTFAEKHPLNKILVIRFSSIGDIVLTTPILRCLKLQQKEVEIHFLTKCMNFSLINNNPYVYKVHCFKENLKEVLPELKAEKFDCIVDLHGNIRSWQVKKYLRIPSSTFPKLNIKKWMLVKTKCDLMPDIHVVDRYFKATETLNIKNDGLGLDYFIPEEDQISITDLPMNFHEGYACMVVGSKHATKQLPTEKIVELCKLLDKPVVLLGDINDRKKAIDIENILGHYVYNACGVFNINQSASIINQSSVVITPDTGLMHIASALKKPIISIWGNTVPQLGMYPYMPDNLKTIAHIFEVKGLSCRPCSKLGYPACPKKHFNCMNQQDLQAIVLLANQYLNA